MDLGKRPFDTSAAARTPAGADRRCASTRREGERQASTNAWDIQTLALPKLTAGSCHMQFGWRLSLVQQILNDGAGNPHRVDHAKQARNQRQINADAETGRDDDTQRAGVV